MNTPEGNTVSTAQLAISLLCSLARNIPEANATMRDGQWARSSFMGVSAETSFLPLCTSP